MDYYCEVCKIFIKLKSKNEHFKSNIHKGLDKCKHIKLHSENPDISNIDRELTFIEYKCSPYVTSNLSDNETMIS